MSGEAEREPTIPFPVEVPYRVRADLRRWTDDDRGHLRSDGQAAAYLAAKLDVLERAPCDACVVAPGADRAALSGALRAVAVAFAAEAPAQVAVSRETLRFPVLGVRLEGPDGRLVEEEPPAGGALPPELVERARRHLRGRDGLERLADAVALAVQEDLAILAEGEDGGGTAELLHVCFPSSWDPAARAGADFAALHGPVPHNEALVAAGRAVVRAMVAKGPFVRYVWSLAPDGSLDRNPRRVTAGGTLLPERTWFRVERQTTRPLDGAAREGRSAAPPGRALFTIRVYLAPLPDVLLVPGRAARLAAAVRSMDDPLRLYKGFGAPERGAAERLLAWLERWSARERA